MDFNQNEFQQAIFDGIVHQVNQAVRNNRIHELKKILENMPTYSRLKTGDRVHYFEVDQSHGAILLVEAILACSSDVVYYLVDDCHVQITDDVMSRYIASQKDALGRRDELSRDAFLIQENQFKLVEKIFFVYLSNELLNRNSSSNQKIKDMLEHLASVYSKVSEQYHNFMQICKLIAIDKSIDFLHSKIKNGVEKDDVISVLDSIKMFIPEHSIQYHEFFTVCKNAIFKLGSVRVLNELNDVFAFTDKLFLKQQSQNDMTESKQWYVFEHTAGVSQVERINQHCLKVLQDACGRIRAAKLGVPTPLTALGQFSEEANADVKNRVSILHVLAVKAYEMANVSTVFRAHQVEELVHALVDAYNQTLHIEVRASRSIITKKMSKSPAGDKLQEQLMKILTIFKENNLFKIKEMVPNQIQAIPTETFSAWKGATERVYPHVVSAQSNKKDSVI